MKEEFYFGLEVTLQKKVSQVKLELFFLLHPDFVINCDAKVKESLSNTWPILPYLQKLDL